MVTEIKQFKGFILLSWQMWFRYLLKGIYLIDRWLYIIIIISEHLIKHDIMFQY